MIHRYKVRLDRTLGPNDTQITGVTTQPPFTELLPVYATKRGQKILAPTTRKINFVNPTTYLTTGTTVSTLNYKHITIPISVEFNPTDNSDLIDNWVFTETKKAINKINNGETVRYAHYPGVTVIFRFLNQTTNTYDDDFLNAGFTQDDIDLKRNNFKKSFFRLYFYDGNTAATQNLLFTEDLDLSKTKIPQLPLDRLYWLRDDEMFINNTIDRTVYMEAKFFNAKTGRVHKFINLPISITSKISVNTYSNPNNHDWRTSPILIKNPNNNFSKYEFSTIPGIGANTNYTITMSEYILT
jgi:hypothetical protein